MRLYRPNGTSAGSSANSGTTAETIIFNSSTIGTYTVYVYGFNSAFNTTSCYTLLVQLSATNFAPETAAPEIEKAEIVKLGGLKVYPVPATGMVNLSFDAALKGNATVEVYDQAGTRVITRTLGVDKGINFGSIDISKLAAGVYFLKVKQADGVKVQKLIVGK